LRRPHSPDNDHACISREVRYLLNPEGGTSALDFVEPDLAGGEDGAEGPGVGWEVGCDNCTRRLNAVKLPNSRLVLVVAEPRCACEARQPPVAHWLPTEGK
jgi:hypothetical protein